MPVTALDLESATVASEQRGKLLGDGDPKMALVFFFWDLMGLTVVNSG